MRHARRDGKTNASRAATLEASNDRTSEDQIPPRVGTGAPARNPEHLSSRPWADSPEHEPADVSMRGPFHLLALHFLAQALRCDWGTDAGAMELDQLQRCRGWDGLAAWAARPLDGPTVARIFVDVVFNVCFPSSYATDFVHLLAAPDPGAKADALSERWHREQRPGAEDAGLIAGTLCSLLDGHGMRPHLALLLCVQSLVSALRLDDEQLDNFGRRLLEELALADVLPEHASRAPRAPARAA